MNTRKFFRFFLNKYFIATLAFVVWMVFFDSNNLLERNRLQQNLESLKQEKQFYLEEIRRDSTLTRKLLSDSATLEKFARERYLMKRANEDLYLIVDSVNK